ncbi:hypothetical protein [Dactylosporangium sp. CA-233914]|uniref:hypothetical protein n=1 Tax=Dactylosporangium sp. CA-233914 TaxID=3239934 RepID=UPI003D8B6323
MTVLSSLTQESAVAHYRGALGGAAWPVRDPGGPSNLLCADRRINGQQVRFILNTAGPASYVAEFSFQPHQQDSAAPGDPRGRR